MFMCGINGFNFNDQGLILKMNRAIQHRGPDQTDFWCEKNISLGHDRLSIIDLSERGKQPMWDEHHELAIVFNGEIYNFQELRKKLANKYNFISESDTEVILYAYKEWGFECVKKFNGIFALAIWDTRTEDLFLARDPLGVKPLYYFYDRKNFIFSSEIKAILEHDITREVNREAFDLYFQVLYIPEPHTMFRGVKKLPAANYLVLKADGTMKLVKYWQVHDFANFSSYQETTHIIRNIFEDSVKRQLVSDRPVGVFLSGGIDSTAVLGAVSKYHEGKIKTFSVGFKDSLSPEKFNADFFLARKTATHYSTDHHELLVGPEDIKNNLQDIVWHLDEPNFNPTAGAIYLLSKEAKKEVAVVLGGDGGDELFGGYPRYYYSRLISTYQRWPSSLQGVGRVFLKKLLSNPAIVEKLSLPPDEKRVLAFLAQKQALLSEVLVGSPGDFYQAEDCFRAKHFKDNHNGTDFEKTFMDIDRQSWLVDESLLRTDKMTMAFGLEERVPILDYRLVGLANKIPTTWKFKIWHQTSANFQGKAIWREAVRDYLPPHILNEKKRGWFTPMAKWLRADLRDYVSEILAPDHLGGEYFNVAGVKKVWDDHQSGARYNLNIIWAIVMWQLWYDRFIKK